MPDPSPIKISEPASPQDRFRILPAWREAGRLVLRSWPVVLVATAALAEASYLIFELLGRCFASLTTSCSPDLFAMMGAGPREAQNNAGLILFKFAIYVVMAPAIYAMFSGRRFAGKDARVLAGSGRRSLRFLGRLTLLWIIIGSQNWIGVALNHWLPQTFPGTPRVLQPVLYYGIILLSLASGLALRVRSAFYLATGAYDERPIGLAQSWRATRGVAARLFVAFGAVDLVAFFVMIGTGLLLDYNFAALGLVGFTRWLIHETGANGDALAVSLPQAIVLVIEFPSFLLLQYALGAVAYRRLFASRDRSVAAVFD